MSPILPFTLLVKLKLTDTASLRDRILILNIRCDFLTEFVRLHFNTINPVTRNKLRNCNRQNFLTSTTSINTIAYLVIEEFVIDVVVLSKLLHCVASCDRQRMLWEVISGGTR